VDYTPFSRRNSLLTDSNKPARARLRQHYAGALESLYNAIEQRKEKRRQELLSRPPSHTDLKERFLAAIELTLGVDEQDVNMEASFAQIGGDSLSAVRFIDNLSQLCGTTIPVASVLNPTATLHDMMAMVEQVDIRSSGGKQLVTAAAIHGEHSVYGLG